MGTIGRKQDDFPQSDALAVSCPRVLIALYFGAGPVGTAMNGRSLQTVKQRNAGNAIERNAIFADRAVGIARLKS
jgi:hypothetical protein